MTEDFYGRRVPKHAHGTTTLSQPTSSGRQIIDAVMALYDEIVNPVLLVRRITIGANRIADEQAARNKPVVEQLDFFTDYDRQEEERRESSEALKKERSIQEALVDLRKRFGKNTVLKGMSLQEGATARQRNEQIGGHKA